MARLNKWFAKALSVSAVGAALDASTGNMILSVSGTASGKTITSITGGEAAQWIKLLFTDSNVTVTSAAVTLAGGAASFAGAAGDVLSIATYDGTTWHETSRKLASAAIPNPGGIAAVTGQSLFPNLCHTGGVTPMVATPGTDTTPSATETYIGQVFVPANCTVTGIAIMNGSAVAGNMAVALADSTGAVVASSASTAVSGTEAFQRVAFSSTYAALGPATYFVLLQNNNTSNRFRSHAVGNFRASKKTGETYGTFTTITVPSTFTASQAPIASLY